MNTIKRRTVLGVSGCMFLAAACDTVAAIFAKAGTVAEAARNWIQLIKGALPALGLEQDRLETFAAAIARTEKALEVLERVGNASEEQQAGDLDAAKAEVEAAYAALYKLSEDAGVIAAIATAEQGDGPPEHVGTPDELAGLLE